MKIETDVTRDFLDEMLYIASYYKSVKKNPYKKVRKITSQFKFLIFFSAIFGIITLLGYLHYQKIFWALLIGSYIFALILLICLMLIYMKKISELLNIGKRTIELNETNIVYVDKFIMIKVKWNDIDRVIINKYSICFLPKNQTDILVAIGIEYKNEVVKTLVELGYKSLIIDNTSSYK